MTTMCDFTVFAEGQKEQLKAIVDYLTPVIAPWGRDAPSIIDVVKLWPDIDLEGEHKWIGLGGYGDEHGKCFVWGDQRRRPDPIWYSRPSNPACDLNEVAQEIKRLYTPQSWKPWGDLEFCPTDDALIFLGTCKWAPPGAFLRRLSLGFPDVVFKCAATNEVAQNYHFYFSNGKCSNYSEWVDQYWCGVITWHWRDGQELDLPEDEEYSMVFDDPAFFDDVDGPDGIDQIPDGADR